MEFMDRVKPLRVLVVDDTKEQREYTEQVISAKFRRDGVRIEAIDTAQDLDEANDKLGQSFYDIIAVDLHLEEPPTVEAVNAEGYQLLEEISRRPEWNTAFRILYSSRTMRGEVPAISEDGVRLYHRYVWIHRSAKGRRQQLENAIDEAIESILESRDPASATATAGRI